MIECTELFPHADFATAYIEGRNGIRINVQYPGYPFPHCIHMDINKLASFLEAVRYEQRKENASQDK
jgi:hypothetical protein